MFELRLNLKLSLFLQKMVLLNSKAEAFYFLTDSNIKFSKVSMYSKAQNVFEKTTKNSFIQHATQRTLACKQEYMYICSKVYKNLEKAT